MSTTLWILAVLTAFVIGPASPTPSPGALTVAQTSRLNVRPSTELVLQCGDRTHTGVVKYWQTPFGQLGNHGYCGDADLAVSMRADGSLLAANASERHSGPYYCLLVAEGGTTLWAYHVVVDLQMARGNSAEPGFSRDPVQLRHRRDLAGFTDGVFAGAVAGSVLLTFVLGFTAGALGRAHVLMCLRVVSSKIRSLRRRQPTGRGCEVVMTTLPGTYHSDVVYDDIDDDMLWPGGKPTLDTPCSSCTSSPPPPKPQRSFSREGQEKEVEKIRERKEGEAEEEYVEERVEVRMNEERRDGWEEEQIREVEKRRERRDKEKENEMEERKGGRHGEEDPEGKKGEQEMEEESGATGEESRVGGDQSMTATTAECSSQAEGGGGGPGSKSTGVAEEKEVGLMEEQKEAASIREEFQNEGGETDASSDSDSDSSSDTQDGREQEEEVGREQAEKEGAEEEAPAAEGVRRGRRSRVIRLYQYDEEGHRYSHLPSPAPGELEPAPRLKQRTLSLTRLSAIMAAATAGPLASPSGGAGGEERCPSPPFSPAAVFKMDF